MMAFATLNAISRPVTSTEETVRAVKADLVAKGAECPVVTESARVPRCSTAQKTVTLKKGAKKGAKAVKVVRATTPSAAMVSVRSGKWTSALLTVKKTEVRKAKEKLRAVAETLMSVSLVPVTWGCA